MIFTQNLKFIYADTSAASAEFLMSAITTSSREISIQAGQGGEKIYSIYVSYW